MAKLTDRLCTSTKPDPDKDVLLGDGNGLYLRVRSGGSRVWILDYVVSGKRNKVTLGIYEARGGTADTIDGLLDGGFLSLAQARLIASDWKNLRRTGRDAAAERLKKKSLERAQVLEELAQPTVSDAISQFVSQHIAGKKSAHAVEYRLRRLAAHIGGRKIRDVTRKEFIATIDQIALGAKGRPAKQLAGEVLTTAKRLWRYAETREWVTSSCIERLRRSDFDARPRKRDVVLRIEEVAQIWSVLGNQDVCKADPVTVAALKLLILTGLNRPRNSRHLSA